MLHTCRRWDWSTLRENISKHGLRNSLLLAPMPTASTAQILGQCPIELNNVLYESMNAREVSNAYHFLIRK